MNLIGRERREILRDAMRLSVPVMLEEALGTVVGYADTAMVGLRAGRTMWRQICSSLAPSIRAAS